MSSGRALSLERITDLAHQLTAELCRDQSHLELPALESARRVSHRLRGVLDAFDIGLTRRADELSKAGGTPDVDKAMNPDGKISRGKANADKKRSEIAGALPCMGDALSRGDLSGEHLDVVARCRNKLTDSERAGFDQRCAGLERQAMGMSLHAFGLHVEHLAERSQIASGAQLAERQRRDRKGREWEDRLSGMRKFLLELDPVEGAKIHDAIHAEINRLVRERRDDPTDHRTIEQLTADAITALMLNGQQQLRRGATELVVLVDYRTLVNGLHDHSVHETWDGTHVNPDTIRRIACDARIVPVVLGGPGELLDAGREQRTATRAQRRVLRAIYRTCSIDGCTVDYERCELHHLVPWWQHGDTDIHNLVPLCDRHHHMVHECGSRLSMNRTNRALTIHHPNGSVTIQPPPGGLAPAQPASRSAGAEPPVEQVQAPDDTSDHTVAGPTSSEPESRREPEAPERTPSARPPDESPPTQLDDVRPPPMVPRARPPTTVA